MSRVPDSEALTVAGRYGDEIDRRLGVEMRTGRRLATAIAAHPTLAYLAIAHTPPGWKAFQDFTRGTALLPDLVGRWPITTSIRAAKTASRLVRAPATLD